MTYLHHGIIRMEITKPVYIELIDNQYAYGFKNDINLKKILIICNINNCFEITMKLDIIFITFNKKNCYSIWWTKKWQRFVAGKHCKIFNSIISTTSFIRRK